MTTLTEKDVNKIAHLARLEILSSEISKHAQDLSKILDFVEQINTVNTDHIEPIAHPLGGIQRSREDKVTEINQRDLLQSNAPQVEAGLYLVPKVIEICDIAK
jgi:aspartyl-tRNA(Asn)/glutamyl-tRNA(Gln) amidotransferase subunit C